jgi:hypothetical protein
MSDVVVLPDSPEEIATTDDVGAYVVAVLDRARTWLQQATTTDLPEIIEARARAEAIRCYIAQKELGTDAQLAAAEIVRRAERRIGELVREGQERGEIRRRGDGGGDPRFVDPHRKQMRMSPTEFFASPQAAHETYAMTDGVTADEFEAVLDEAKAERNLTRANVVRKARQLKTSRDGSAAVDTGSSELTAEHVRRLVEEGRTSEQIGAVLGVGAEHVRRLAADAGIALRADEVIGRVRRIDSNRIVRETVDALDGLASVVELVERRELDPDAVDAWVASLRRSLRALHRFTKELST